MNTAFAISEFETENLLEQLKLILTCLVVHESNWF